MRTKDGCFLVSIFPVLLRSLTPLYPLPLLLRSLSCSHSPHPLSTTLHYSLPSGRNIPIHPTSRAVPSVPTCQQVVEGISRAEEERDKGKRRCHLPPIHTEGYMASRQKSKINMKKRRVVIISEYQHISTIE